jgi:membrane protein
MLVAAALTCYAAFGLVPLLAIGSRIAAAVFGRDDVVRAAAGVAQFVHGPLHLDRGIVQFASTAASAKWWTVVVAVLPASLYAEGTVRSLERFSTVPERHSRALRGRLLTAVYVAAAVVAVGLLVGVVRPLLFDPFGSGLGPRLLGIFVAFNILFFANLAVLTVVYRFFATTRIRLGPLLLAAGAASSWLASQTLAYLAVVRAVSGFANAFGGYAPVGAVAAFAFLIYLEHLVVLLGYVLALRLHEEPVLPVPR